MSRMVKTVANDLSYSSSDGGFEPGSDELDRPESASPFLEAGSDLLRKLLVQLTLNDSPPSNDYNDTRDATKEMRQPPPPTESWSETEIQNKSNVSLKQQGHISLAKLCTSALETLEQRTCQAHKHDISRRKKENAHKDTKNISSEKKTQPFHWKKTKNKKNSHQSKGESWNSDSSNSDFREGRDASEARRDENEFTPRLQMFGSEYARYLSTTPLAPKDASNQSSRRAFSRRTLKNSLQNIEDADAQVQSGPITDIIVIRGDEKPPKGYFRVSQSLSGKPFRIEDRKATFFLCVKKERNWDRAAQRPCVTAVSIIFPDRKEFVPPGFSLVRSPKLDATSSAQPINFNEGGSEPVYFCFRRSREGNPLTGIIPLLPSRRELIPDGYTVLERSPRNFVATFRSSKAPVFLSYRQRLANLELLRPPPLVMSMLNGNSKVIRLESYYCTGGTVVKSKVGGFHIMDRSTHSLLSPSSIKHRLTLIELSRRKTWESISEHPNIVGAKYSYSDTSSVRSTPSSSNILPNGSEISEHRTIMSDSDRQSSVADFESVTSSSDIDGSFSSFTTQETRTSVRMSESSKSKEPLTLDAHKDLHRCLEALSFIPKVSTGFRGTGSIEATTTFEARTSILLPILTSCYTKHGGSAFLSITGLTDLLHQDFYADDIEMSQDPSARTTLLDLSIQVACDVATMGAQEAQLHACVEFVEESIKFGCGYLSTRSIGYVIRFFLFVFHFGISSPSGNWGIVSASDQYLLEDIRCSRDKWTLPGGAPQSAILALKDLIVFMIARLGSQVHFDQCSHQEITNSNSNNATCPHFNFIDTLLNKVVDDSVFRVDIANFTELAMHQIMRSGGSELFWYEMINLCGSGLFGSDTMLREQTRHMYAICFTLLANCVKNASSKVRKNEKFEGYPRDVANKLMSLEMLKFFLEKWERGVDSQDIAGSHSNISFAFCIRRLVVPCLLTNTSDALSDPRIFRRLIQIVGVLWCSPFYRKHMKLEIGILFDHFVLKLLKLGPQILFKSNDSKDTPYIFAQQLELMKEIKNWFSGDTDRLLELYLNFDSDYGTHQVGRRAKAFLPDLEWKVSEQLFSLLCNISEDCTEFLGDKIEASHSFSPIKKLSKEDVNNNDGYEGLSVNTLARESARRLRQGALDAISLIVKGLALSAAESLGGEFVSITEAWYYGQKYTNNGKVRVRETNREMSGSNFRRDSALVVNYWNKLGGTKIKNDNHVKALDSHATIPERNNAMRIAIIISKEKGLRKAIEYLIACDVLTASPREISSFLRVHCSDFDASILGKYLGVGGSEFEMEFWNQIRYNYIRATSFVGMTIEEGLRHLLTEGGFRLPGEAQQIDRLISTFARCYWEDNIGDQIHCPVDDKDTIFLISFAIIILNTDLHKSSHSLSGGKRRNKLKKMTKDEFITNIQRANKGKEINKEYLSKIYDGIESNPIALHAQIDDDNDLRDLGSTAHLKKSIGLMNKNVKNLDALLRGLAIHEYKYFPLKDFSAEVGSTVDEAKLCLARSIMTKSWHQVHGLINSALKIAHLDPKALESCIDLLKFSLCLTILLDMPIKQSAFLDQLGRFRLFNTSHKGSGSGRSFASSFNDHESYKKEKWYMVMKRNIHLNKEESFQPEIRKERVSNKKIESLLLLNNVVDEMGMNKTAHVADAARRRIMRDVTRRIENAEFLLNDPTRSFLREGDIMKRANRSGKDVEYRFFLFSDILIYSKKIKRSSAKFSASSPIKYRIHEELPLIMMKVVDWFPPAMKKEESTRAIQFYHPRKNFLVLCSSRDERNKWVKDIRQAIDKELKRKIGIENARKAANRFVSKGNTISGNLSSNPDPTPKSCLNPFS